MQNQYYYTLPPDSRETIDQANNLTTRRAIELASIQNQFRLTTERFAEAHGVKASSVRRRFCVTGSYFGIRPLKCLSGRLLWPDARAAA